MKDNKIIKALECCIECDTYCDECSEDCPLKETNDCTYALRRNSLDLINRQKAEIERLRKANGLLEYLKKAVCRVEIDGEEELIDYASDEAFQNAITKRINLMCNAQTAKSEAYKEFAELVNRRLFKGEKYAYEREYINNLLSEVSDNA